MFFSECNNIEITGEEDWFDPWLEIDTPLFIDPYLIENSSVELISNSFGVISKYFQEVFEKIVKNNKKGSIRNSPLFIAMLSFPEVSELCLGYSQGSVKGAGLASTFALKFYDSFREYMALGLEDSFKHIEAVGLFAKGMGPDRVSDMAANIIKKSLIKYTQGICKEYNIPLKRKPIANYEFDFKNFIWSPAHIELPENPFSKKGIILVPKDILRIDPIISARYLESYLRTLNANLIRDTTGVKITASLDREKLKKIVQKNPEFLKDFLAELGKKIKVSPYDLERDEQFRYRFHQMNRLMAEMEKPDVGTIKGEKEFFAFVEKLCTYTKNTIENRAHRFFWHGENDPRKELYAQKLIDMIIRPFCEANDIGIDAESNAGRGPVDFKFSQGYHKKVHMEVKFVSNSSFWDAPKGQLPLYMKVDDGRYGIFFVIAHYPEELEKKDELEKLVKEVSAKKNMNIKSIFVDATYNKPSASKVKEI